MPTLFKRLSGLRAPTVIDDIVDNLRALLNTRVGDGHTAPTFGVELEDLLPRWPASRAEVLARIRDAIELYEPRLAEVTVLESSRTDDAGLRLRLEIHATLRTGGAVIVKTELAPCGGIAVAKQ